MLSPKEKRFKRYWEEQRKGGKWSYLVLYTFCCTFIAFVPPFLLGIFSTIFSFLHLETLPLWVLLLLALAVCFSGSYYFWERNEKKWRSISDKAPDTAHPVS